uniref:Rho GTPase-activating protein SYDE1 n=1 Tax=Haplochromis burtoni TaxID=8153 RepID=A0A3Q2VHH0_HAPBU
MQQCGDRMCTSLAWDKTSASCVSTTMQQESYYQAGDPAESPSTSVSAKLSGQRAYLQSLDRSSRAWVLSSGKTADEVCDPQEDSGSNIWYNPIPEEEDLGVLQPPQSKYSPPDSSPASQKKGGVSGSMIDRLRSPGTVRKLSLKMKKLPELRRKLSLRSSSRAHRTASLLALSNQNVISKYHLDSSTSPARPQRRSSRGWYLSDGDSPELLPRQQPSQHVITQDGPCDVSSFQLYVGSDPPRCSQRVTGLLTVHLLGLEEMKTIFLVIQIDGVTRARTALLMLRGSALPLNHTFHLELERARQLRIVVLTPGNTTKPHSASQGCVHSHSRYLVGLLHHQCLLQCSVPNGDASTPSSVFGVELHHLVEKEGSATPVPLLIQKTVAEIERRGLKVVGLYRLCGSAAVKKELRDWFERNSSAVCLSEDLYPDINVITGILKDYLRELPSPLITRTLYQVVREAMTLRPPPVQPATPDPQLSQRTVELLSCLPPPERATLLLLLDHLSLVASLSAANRMTHQNLAVCFGPVLLTPTQDAWRGGGGKSGRGSTKGFYHGEEMASAVDFKRHIEALHYLLQLWPGKPYRPQRHPALRLALPQSPEEEVVVSRRGRGGVARLESPPPINRYAGDWSVCGQEFLTGQDADYDEVAGSESDAGGGGALYMDDFLDFDAPFNCRLSLKDFDTLIHDLDRELAKQICL